MMFRLLAVAFLLLPLPAAALSNAATYPIEQTVAEGCPNGGIMDPASVIERDLDGDGRDDLILSHEGLTCSGGGGAISEFCGTQVCTMRIYLRLGDLLRQEAELPSSLVSIEAGRRPVIKRRAHGGTTRRIRWTGQAFGQ